MQYCAQFYTTNIKCLLVFLQLYNSSFIVTYLQATSNKQHGHGVLTAKNGIGQESSVCVLFYWNLTSYPTDKWNGLMLRLNLTTPKFFFKL